MPTAVAETSRCHLVFRNFRLRQHLQLDFDVLHVGDLPKARNQFLSGLDYRHTLQGNRVNRIYPRFRFTGDSEGLFLSDDVC